MSNLKTFTENELSLISTALAMAIDKWRETANTSEVKGISRVRDQFERQTAEGEALLLKIADL